MGIFDALARFATRAAPPVPYDEPDSVRIYVPPRPGGIYVNHDVALTYSAFWAAVRVISETVAQLPWNVFRRSGTGQKKLENHELQRLLNVSPNPETDAFTFRTVMLGWALTWGNAYAEIERDRSGRVMFLWQIPPDKVDIDRINGELYYSIRNDTGPPMVIPAARMLHVKGLGWDGQKGYSVVSYHARTIGAALGQREYASNFVDSAAVPAGVLKNDRQMSPEAKRKWIESFAAAHQGAEKKRRLLIIDEGMSYETIGVPPETAQLLENEKMSVLDICRIFGVAPHLLAEMEFATFSNIEEQGRDSAIRWIVPWSKRMEAPINTQILEGSLYSRHNYNALIRADIEKRYNAYATGTRNGWLSPNDIRELEDMNGIGEQGDVYMVQGQMVTLEDIINPPEPPPPPTPPMPPGPPDNSDTSDTTPPEPPVTSENQRQAFVDLLGDVFRRACQRIHHRVKRQAVPGALADHYKYLYGELIGPAQSIYGALSPDIDPDSVEILVRMAACEFNDRSRDLLDGGGDVAEITESWVATRAQDAAAKLFGELRTVAYVRGRNG